MTFFVKFWGTRGSIPTPGKKTQKYGGNTSCVEIRDSNSIFICDGGTGLRELGMDYMTRKEVPKLAHLFFSHCHWDHVQGFPFFIPAYSFDHTFFIYDIASHDLSFYDLLSGQMTSNYFPVDFSHLRANLIQSILGRKGYDIDGVKVTFKEQVHPGKSFCYKFSKENKSIVYSTDHEIDLLILNREECDKDSSKPREVPEDLVEFVRGVDLLISDGQYFDDEYETKVGWGHPRASTVIDWAIKAEVKQLAIFHHDPLHNDEKIDQKIELCKKRIESQNSDMLVFGAREGVEIKV